MNKIQKKLMLIGCALLMALSHPARSQTSACQYDPGLGGSFNQTYDPAIMMAGKTTATAGYNIHVVLDPIPTGFSSSGIELCIEKARATWSNIH